MKPEYFRRLASFSVCIFIAILFSAWQLKPKGEFYQLTVYHYTTVQQEQLLDNYLQQALLPALHRNGVSKIGVLKAIANDTSVLKTLYVVMPLKNLESITTIQGKLADDADYQAAGSAYINAVYTSPAYDRMETILLKAFPMAPPLQIPQLKAPKNERVYELRSYESASEKIFKSKVHMFNEGDEIGIFTKLNFNAIFYSTVIAGGKMPNLMYMTSFENMDDRNAHWKAFGSDTAWTKLKSLPQYQNNVSHIDISFLRPAPYSDF